MLTHILVDYSAQAGKGFGRYAPSAFACLRGARNKQRLQIK